MAKIVLNNIASGFASTGLINTNNDAIEAELNNNVLYRNNPTGEPNQMENELDMNSNKITNLKAGVANSDAVTIAQLNGAAVNTGVIAVQTETQLGSDAVGQRFTLSGISFDSATVNLVVYINGVNATEGKDYTLTSPNIVDWIGSFNTSDFFKFQTNTQTTNSTTTTAAVTHTVDGTATNLATYLQNQRVVNAEDFRGAALTDTQTVQAAVDYCITNDTDLNVDRIYTLTSSINIDRQVDGPTFDHYFTIKQSNGGGFRVSTAIPMFSTTISFTTAPVSQLIKFKDLLLESTNSALAAYVLDDAKFLRVVFDNCSFRKIKCLSAPTVHTQSIYFLGGQARRHVGTFFSSQLTSFDIMATGLLVEAGTTAFDLKQAVGCRFFNTIEGQSGFAYKINGSQALSIQGYFEGNGTDLDLSLGDHYGVSLNGCYFSTPVNSFSVLWGHAVGCSSTGCYGTGGVGLHSLSSNSEVDINDFNATTTTTSIAGYARHGKPYMAIGLNAPINLVGGSSATFATSVMTVTIAPTEGAFAVGQYINSVGVPAHTKIASLGTGSGGTGTYNLDVSISTPITVAQAVTVSDTLHLHSGANTTLALTDDVLGSGYGGAVRGYSVTGKGGFVEVGTYNNGVYSPVIVVDENKATAINNLPVFANEAAAVTGGILTNSIYKTTTGEIRIKL